MMTSSVTTNWGSLILHGINPTGKEIGRGAYGRVFEVDYEGTLCAAKELHALLLQYAQGEDLQKIKDDFLSECQIWSTLRHPCVVQFLGNVTDSHILWVRVISYINDCDVTIGVYYPAMDQYRLPVMIMEEMQHSLRGLVEKYDNIPLNVKLSILDEVCLGLRYLHSRNPPIVHRDLTPNNILLSYRLEAKITDLGVAKVMKTDKQKTMTKLPGTPDFMPPEALSIRPVYGPSLDVFSYGGVILNITTQLWPQPTDRNQLNPDTDVWEVVSEVKRRQEYLDKMTGDAADLKPLVMSCLNDSPKNRPPVSQVSMKIKRVKDVCSKKNSRDGMSPIVWWAEVSNDQQSQVTSSLTTPLEELRREIDALKIDNTQLRTNNATMKDENKQMTAALDKMAVNHKNQVQQINSQSSEIFTMKNENKQLRTNNATMKDEIGWLKTENDMIKAENFQLKTCHVDTSRSLHAPPAPPKAIEHKLKQQLVLKESITPGDLFSGPVNIKWEEGAPAPAKCYDNTAMWLNGLVYVGSGYQSGAPLYCIHCYDSVINSWRSSINTSYCHFAMTTLNNKLLIAGGRDKSYKITNQILTMDAGQLKNYTKMTTARSGATATGHKGMLIITGGLDFKRNILSSTELFNSNNAQWYKCSDLPLPHYLQQSVIVDNILYLLGGYNEAGAPSLAVFPAPLDTLTRHQLNWKIYLDTPCHPSAPVSVHGTHLLIVGGYKKIIGEKNTKTSEIYKLNKSSHSWETIGHIPSARSLAAAVSTANKVIVIGGVNDKGHSTNTVWIGSCEPH